MKKITRRSFLGCVAGSTAAVALAGCSSSDSTTTTTSTSTSSTTSSDGSTEVSGVAGDGVLSVSFGQAYQSLTPFRDLGGNNVQTMRLMYETLGVLDSDGVTQPWVAKSWSTDDNGFTYNVEIYDNVYDSEGTHITSADVVWAILEHKDRGLRAGFAKIASCVATGDYSFEMVMTSNIVGAVETILTQVYVISQAAFEASDDEFATSIVSTSPYLMSEFVADSTISFEKRSDYWQDEDLLPPCVRPKVEKLKFYTITEASQAGIALETGVVDLCIELETTTALQYIDNSAYVVDEVPGAAGWEMFFSGHASRPVGEDLNLRLAMCYCLDPDGLITGLCQGYGEDMHDVCTSSRVGYIDAWEDEPYFPYDPDYAKELLAQSNYNGEEVIIFTWSDTFNERMCTMLQAYMLDVGINAVLYLPDSAETTAIRFDGSKYDVFINTINLTYMTEHWGVRYDSYAYDTGDATSRFDEELTNLVYTAWTVDGFTEENITAVHEYLRDNAIARGMFNASAFYVWNSDLAVTDKVLHVDGNIAVQASTFTSY